MPSSITLEQVDIPEDGQKRIDIPEDLKLRIQKYLGDQYADPEFLWGPLKEFFAALKVYELRKTAWDELAADLHRLADNSRTIRFEVGTIQQMQDEFVT